MEEKDKMSLGNNDDMKHAIDSLTDKITTNFSFMAQVEILACIKKNISTQMYDLQQIHASKLDEVQKAIEKLKEI